MFHQTALIVAVFTTVVLAQLPVATIPTADRKGSKDNPLLKRYEGSFIVAYERKGFGELTLPLSPIERVTPVIRTPQNNNRVYEPKNKKALEGAYTRLAYLLPAERSPLEVLRNYQDEVKSQGGKILFECKGAECGGDQRHSTAGGGGDMSLSMYPLSPRTDDRSSRLQRLVCVVGTDHGSALYGSRTAAEQRARFGARLHHRIAR